jgi:hypothetical protein
VTRGQAVGLVGVAAVLAVTPVVASALPPGGPAENPGTPPATVSLGTAPVRATAGQAVFTGEGFLNAAGAPQKVYVKIDDHGERGIGPFVADATGHLEGSVALDRPEAPADITDPSRVHWLRFLTGPSGQDPDNGPPRSLKATFRVVAPPVRAVASALTVRGGRVALPLRAAAPKGSRGTVTVRAATTVLARGPYALAGTATRTVRVALTAAGRRRVARASGAVRARLTLTPAGGAAVRTAVTLTGAGR